MLLNLAKGARNSMVIGLGAVGVGLLIGGTLGLIAGYYQRGVDATLSTFFNTLLAIPQFVLALSLVTVFASTAIDKSGQPTSSVVDTPARRADHRARHRVDPDPGAHHARQHAAVVAAGVRLGRPFAGRDRTDG